MHAQDAGSGYMHGHAGSVNACSRCWFWGCTHGHAGAVDARTVMLALWIPARSVDTCTVMLALWIRAQVLGGARD
eukprot:1141024-Pelagomonas_calceolata.AAC.5